jgi:hypothetical protein
LNKQVAIEVVGLGLNGKQVGRWLIGCLDGRMDELMVGWLVGWFWFVGCLVGCWLVEVDVLPTLFQEKPGDFV